MRKAASGAEDQAMTFDEWLAAEVARLQRFAKWWAQQPPSEDWPDRIDAPKWVKQGDFN